MIKNYSDTSVVRWIYQENGDVSRDWWLKGSLLREKGKEMS